MENKSYAERHEELKADYHDRICRIVSKRRGKVLIPYHCYQDQELYDSDIPDLKDCWYDVREEPGKNLEVTVFDNDYEICRNVEIVAVIYCHVVSLVDKEQYLHYLRDVVSLVDWIKIHSALVEATK